MFRFYISKNYSDKFTASSKAKMDCEYIIKNLGYYNLGLPQNYLGGKIGRIWTYLSHKIGISRIPQNSIFFCQYPTFGIEKAIKKAKMKGNQVLLIIHDINALRQKANDSLKPLMEADILIAHNNNMKNWLINNGFKQPIFTLKIFDYITNGNDILSPQYPLDGVFSICFAGNLAKSTFLNYLDLTTVKVKLFGIGADQIRQHEGLVYMGCFSPEELRYNLKSHFGLVWDGTSCDTCDGINGEYLKYIAPHKLSMYLSANIPVIVWSKSAMANFVNINNIGFAVDSLCEIQYVLRNISKQKYAEMVTNSTKIGEQIRTGYFLSSVITEIEEWQKNENRDYCSYKYNCRY